LTRSSQRPSGSSSKPLQAGPIRAPNIRRDADGRIDRSFPPGIGTYSRRRNPPLRSSAGFFSVTSWCSRRRPGA
jgi:hypothetical protein